MLMDTLQTTPTPGVSRPRRRFADVKAADLVSLLIRYTVTKFGPLPDLSFSGITTFARLPHHKCLEDRSKDFDIAGRSDRSLTRCTSMLTVTSQYLGHRSMYVDLYPAVKEPNLLFVSAERRFLQASRALVLAATVNNYTDLVLSSRTGARFGPFAIRSGSRRHAPSRGYSIPWAQNPFRQGGTIVDCGDM